MARKLSSRSLATMLLKAVAVGGVLAALFVAPNLGVALKPFLKHDDWRTLRAKERRRIREEIRRLKERRLVEIAVKNGKEYLQITEAGKQRLKEFEIETITLPRKDRWDKKWRIVMFDIPEIIAAVETHMAAGRAPFPYRLFLREFLEKRLYPFSKPLASQTKQEIESLLGKYFSIVGTTSAGDYPEAEFYPIYSLIPKHAGRHKSGTVRR